MTGSEWRDMIHHGSVKRSIVGSEDRDQDIGQQCFDIAMRCEERDFVNGLAKGVRFCMLG